MSSLRDCAHRPNKIAERKALFDKSRVSPKEAAGKTLYLYIENPSVGAPVTRCAIENIGDDIKAGRARLAPMCCAGVGDRIHEDTLKLVNDTCIITVLWNTAPDIWCDEVTLRLMLLSIEDEIVRVWHDSTKLFDQNALNTAVEYIRHYRGSLRTLDMNFSLMRMHNEDVDALMYKLHGLIRGTAHKWHLRVAVSKIYRYTAMKGGSPMLRVEYTFKPRAWQQQTESVYEDALCQVCHLVHPDKYEQTMLLCDKCDRGYHRGCLNPKWFGHIKRESDPFFCPHGVPGIVGCKDAKASVALHLAKRPRLCRQ